MPLTELEQKTARKTVDRFLNDQPPLKLKELEIELQENYEVIDRLAQAGIIRTRDQQEYLPSALAFHYCGSSEIEALARRGVELLVMVLRKLYPEDNPNLKPLALLENAREFDANANENLIRVAMEFSDDFGLFNGWKSFGQSARWFEREPNAIRRSVLKMTSPEKVWDDVMHPQIERAERALHPEKFNEAGLPRFDGNYVTVDPSAFGPQMRSFRPNTAFIIMQINRDNPKLDDVKNCIKRVFDEFGVSAIRADEIEHSDVITQRILDEIATSEFLIADLTGERPSVYYEVGYAHAVSKRPILYREMGTKLHFDLSVHNVPEYKNITELESMLRIRLATMTNKTPVRNVK